MISYFIVFLTGLNLALLLAVLFLSLREIGGQFIRIRNYTWLALLIIILFGTSLRAITPHHHMIFIDEYWAMESSRNILLDGRAELCEYLDYEQVKCVPYHKLAGTPFMFSIAFSLFGISTYSAIYLNIFLGSLSILLIFLLSYILSGREDSALYASLLFATYPLYIMWSGSASTNIPGIFFFLLTLLSFLVYLKTRTYRLGALAVLSLAYAMQTRLEMIFIVPLILIAYIVHDKRTMERIRNSRLWNLKAMPFIIFVGIISRKFTSFFTLLMMLFLFRDKETRRKLIKGRDLIIWVTFLFFFTSFSLQAMNYSAIFYATGDMQFTSFELYQTTLTDTLGYIYGIIVGVYFTPPLIILSLIGALFLARNDRKTLLIAISVFFVFSYWFIIAHLFSNTEKLLLFSGIGLIILASAGAALLTDILKSKTGREIAFSAITILILALFFPYIYPHYNNMGMEQCNLDAKALETRIPETIGDSIPGECYIIAKYPSVLSAAGLKTISLYNALENPDMVKNIYNRAGCVIFYEDMGCLINKSIGRTARVFSRTPYSGDCYIQKSPSTDCEAVKENYNAEPFREYTLGNITYTFYRLSA